MNYDRNGVLATQSRPKPVLRKCYRTVTVDSRDRDPTKYVKTNGGATASDPGDYVVYLPRPFQKVTRIRLMNAAMLGVQPSDTYIMMQLEGLNRMDECASGADRSGYVDSTFAKILNDRPVVATGAAYTFSTITGVSNRVFTTPDISTTQFTGPAALTITSKTATTVVFGTSVNVGTNVVTIYGFTGAAAVYNGTWTASSASGSAFTITTTLGGIGGTVGSGFVANVSGNNTISTAITASGTSWAAFATNPTANALLTNITFAATNTYSVGQNVNVSGYTGIWAPLNGSYVVLSASPANFTVASSAPIPTTGTPQTATTQSTCVLTATGTGTVLTYTFNGAHNIAVGQTITVALSGQSGGPYMTGVVTSVPTSSTLTMASTYVGTTNFAGTTTVTVNNLQYSYQTQITTSFVAGQYLVISGLTDKGANAAAQILQSSLSTGTSGTFETTNIIYSPTTGLPTTLTAAGTSGTAIISQAIYYNDMSYAPNITYYNPPIGTLDRFHITLRRHLPLSSVSITNPTNAPITFGPAENTFTFEIEYIDNVFEDVSTFETRLDSSTYEPTYQR